MTGQEALVALALKYRGDWDKMVQGVKSHECFDSEEDEKAVKALTCPYVTLIDKAYPESFKHCFRPPLVLFYRGDLSLLEDENHCISYIGSREATEYGLAMAKTISGQLAHSGYVVVSGLAKGIDSAATRGALEEHGLAVGVLGCGIDVCYPSSSQDLYERLKKEGLLLSEYPFSTPPQPWYFPRRNRIVASLSKGLVVGEATNKSGTLITVSFALGEDKEIGCVPALAGTGSACNLLIKEGAWLIEDVNDIDLMMGRINEDQHLRAEFK
jgi:DNA processing protein